MGRRPGVAPGWFEDAPLALTEASSTCPDSRRGSRRSRVRRRVWIWRFNMTSMDLTGWQKDGSFTVKLSSRRLLMPSPGISFGDLMVFIAVVVIVAVFLAAVRLFIRREENPDPPAQPRAQPAELH